MHRTTLLIIATFLAMCTQLFSGDATFYGGVQNPGALNFNNVLEVASVSNKSGAVFGARVSGGQVLGFEWSAGVSPSFLESSQWAFNTQTNLIIGIPAEKFVPYGTVGAGFIRTGGALTVIRDIGSRFTINYGGGLKIRNLAGPIGVRFDIRGYTIPRISVGSANLQTHLNFLESTMGLLFSW